MEIRNYEEEKRILKELGLEIPEEEIENVKIELVADYTSIVHLFTDAPVELFYAVSYKGRNGIIKHIKSKYSKDKYEIVLPLEKRTFSFVKNSGSSDSDNHFLITKNEETGGYGIFNPKTKTWGLEETTKLSSIERCSRNTFIIKNKENEVGAIYFVVYDHNRAEGSELISEYKYWRHDIPMEYKEVKVVEDRIINRMFEVIDKENKHGLYIRHLGKDYIIPSIYDGFGELYWEQKNTREKGKYMESLYKVVISGGKEGLYDILHKKVVIPPIFDKVIEDPVSQNDNSWGKEINLLDARKYDHFVSSLSLYMGDEKFIMRGDKYYQYVDVDNKEYLQRCGLLPLEEKEPEYLIYDDPDDPDDIIVEKIEEPPFDNIQIDLLENEELRELAARLKHAREELMNLCNTNPERAKELAIEALIRTGVIESSDKIEKGKPYIKERKDK